MIDSRGQVRITDFGLAVLAQEVQLGDIRSGTPAYMSPEQKAGKEVTVRSDLYSLGATLYEMFTGKRRIDTQSQPTEIVKDLDPAVERTILRCLEEDPKRRPSSALSVAMALPGGDPVAAALAAGETPSPEMVAASGEKEGFSPRTATLCFVGMLACILLILLSGVKDPGLFRIAAPEIPPEVLGFRAQDMLRDFGYTEKPGTSAWGFDCCDGQNLRFAEKLPPAKRDEMLAGHRPPVLGFWYRQSRAALVSMSVGAGPGVISWNEPPNDQPGMVRVHLDAAGRLFHMEARPPARDRSSAAAAPFDWNKLLRAAQLDPARFAAASPASVPPMAFDARMAWTGSYADSRPERVRVEAAAWEGRPVFFDVSGSGSSPSNPRITGRHLFPWWGRALSCCSLAEPCWWPAGIFAWDAETGKARTASRPRRSSVAPPDGLSRRHTSRRWTRPRRCCWRSPSLDSLRRCAGWHT
jgi:serine/threonine-protein kinase